MLIEDRPDTISAVSNLANSLRDKGELEKAAMLLRKMLQAMKQAFGEDRLQIMKVSNNRAGILKRQGELEGAESIQQDALGIMRQGVEDQHQLLS